MDPLTPSSPREGAGDVDPSDPEAVLELFARVCARTAAIVAANDDWDGSGRRDGQYSVDLTVDDACLEMLHGAGLRVLSEESGVTERDVVGDVVVGGDAGGVGEFVAGGGGPDAGGAGAGGARHRDGYEVRDPRSGAIVVVDPLDGSTNAALGLPWCATSLCLVVDGVPEVATVANLRTGAMFTAVRSQGARLDGNPIRVSPPMPLSVAVIAVNARPPDGFRPAQFRAMGATALDIASVAAGGFDGSIDFDDDRIGVWDYLAGTLIVTEAGGVVADARGRDLVTLDPRQRRRPVTATHVGLLDELLAHG
ncbi:inositol monophosphatase family protein [Ilumatobacter sp.]|uniref:inositol monophosphatase family protein n=1 Tax=Ilumatobacter sp. TaxID=1967498 RepID=UPI003B5248DD